MPRNMSFMLTKPQVRDRTKTVTRRKGWVNLKPGDVLNACEKAMGLRKGERVAVMCQIRVVDARREPLKAMTLDPEYGRQETTKEGYPPGMEKHDPEKFVAMFCQSMHCIPSTEVTRIEFEYVD